MPACLAFAPPALAILSAWPLIMPSALKTFFVASSPKLFCSMARTCVGSMFWPVLEPRSLAKRLVGSDRFFASSVPCTLPLASQRQGGAKAHSTCSRGSLSINGDDYSGFTGALLRSPWAKRGQTCSPLKNMPMSSLSGISSTPRGAFGSLSPLIGCSGWSSMEPEWQQSEIMVNLTP